MDINEAVQTKDSSTQTENEQTQTEETTRKVLSDEERKRLLSKKIEVSMNLLLNMRILLDASVNRATFKAGELSQVGSVYDDINSLINSNMSL